MPSDRRIGLPAPSAGARRAAGSPGRPTPAAGRIWNVRGWTTCAAGASCGPAGGWMIRLGIPSRERRSDDIMPAGPAPTTSTGVSTRIIAPVLAQAGLIVGDLARDAPAPLVVRLPVAGGATHLLGPAEDLGVVEGEVEQLAERLMDVPWAVDDQLERVPLGVAGVERPRVAVVERDEVGVPLRDQPLLDAAQRREVFQPERQLEDRGPEAAAEDGPLEDRPLRPAGRQHQLVVLGGVGREEDEPRDPARDLTPIRHGHAEDARVEVLHAREVETA